jgi:hypothetical protein
MQTCLIGMEACSGAHFLGRVLRELLPQQHLACCAQSYEVKGSLA